MKKKGGVSTSDQVVIYYRFESRGEYLSKAIEVEKELIANAVRRPFLPMGMKKEGKVICE